MSDLISRQDAVEAIRDLPNCRNGYSDAYDKAQIIGVLEGLPSAQPERKKGKWLLFDGYSCSRCNYKPQTTGLPRYCPNCGADMRGENHEIN